VCNNQFATRNISSREHGNATLGGAGPDLVTSLSIAASTSTSTSTTTIGYLSFFFSRAGIPATMLASLVRTRQFGQDSRGGRHDGYIASLRVLS
jgi:hypothetical protein